MAVPVSHHAARDILKAARVSAAACPSHLQWLQSQMHPYFFITLQDESQAIADLAIRLPELQKDQRLVLVDREKKLVLACPSRPGSLYATLRTLPEKEISYAQFTHSYAPAPGLAVPLEIQIFEFDRRDPAALAAAAKEPVPPRLAAPIRRALKEEFPDFNFADFARRLQLVWSNNENYVRISPPRRVAQLLWLYQQGRSQGGVFVDALEVDAFQGGKEFRVYFAAGNPPQKDFLIQVMEVFKRLGLGVQRAYCLTLSDSLHPYFLGTFYVTGPGGSPLSRESALFAQLREELFTTQILSATGATYQSLVTSGLAGGADTALVEACIGFCHTQLAHTHPDSFDLEGVMRAFHNHPDLTLQLVRTFRTRFDPALTDRDVVYPQALEETRRMIEHFSSGRRFLDDYRRTIFRCALVFLSHTLKSNFFVPEKHALAFRLDPAYLDALDGEFNRDLPLERPFRVTFFSGRYGLGYHIGFSDIARGGWRTLITQGRDDYVTAANTLFRENYVLAHTQHLKNKDIYEGGSKLVAVLAADVEDDPATITARLYKLQFGFINAFLDLFVTENGRAKDPRVVDYYGEDEPIELGPDENMHDVMVELIARQARKRGYLLGSGIMSSKAVGINHKEYGVTSTGVVRFAEVVLAELGIDLRRAPFTVNFTGGPGGDVAGNGLRLLLERAPLVRIRLIVDGSGALFDPLGADREALSHIVLKDDVVAFAPEALHPGGFLLYRGQRRREGMRELFRKVRCTEAGLVEEWISSDDFHREFNDLIFTVPADLFIPAGGRPETIDGGNWQRFFDDAGISSLRAIVEGANSFLTPEARTELQRRGIVIMRDASANKCGVISSSYEVIANLLLSDHEFLTHKERYVGDVLAILDRRAEEEARLIFRRHRAAAGALAYTEISNAISQEINAHYARLFQYFQQHPELRDKPLYRQALARHLPRILIEEPRFRRRLGSLPAKIHSAILASETASSLVYRGDDESDYAAAIERHLRRIGQA